MKIYFTEETVGSVVSTHPIYDSATNRLVGVIFGPASSRRTTWRAIFQGYRIGDFKTAELAKAAVELKASK